jgi:hypothetical protein
VASSVPVATDLCFWLLGNDKSGKLSMAWDSWPSFQRFSPDGFEWLAGDLNRDCKVDFPDFVNFAASWLDENYSTE